MEEHQDTFGERHFGPLPELDVPLLRKTMETIDEVPAVRDWAHLKDARLFWNQNVWRSEYGDGVRCGTAMCFAGWACHLNGDEFMDGDMVIAEEGQTIITIRDRAQKILGLTDTEANLLFHGGNNRRTLHQYVDALIKNREQADGAA